MLSTLYVQICAIIPVLRIFRLKKQHEQFCHSHKERRELFSSQHNIPADMCFSSYKDILECPQLAPLCFNTTMDQEHLKSSDYWPNLSPIRHRLKHADYTRYDSLLKGISNHERDPVYHIKNFLRFRE